MTKKKICIVGDLFLTLTGGNRGGGENQLVLAAKVLRKIGFDLIIVDWTLKEKYISIEGIEFVPLISERTFLDKLTKRTFLLYRTLKNIKCDIYFTSISTFQHFIPLLVAKINGAKFYYWVAADLELENILDRIKYKYWNKLKINTLINIILDEVFFPIVLRKADIVFVQHINQLKRLNRDKKFILSNVVEDSNLEKKNMAYFIWVGSIDFDKGFKVMEKLVKDLDGIPIKIVGKLRSQECSTILTRITSTALVEYMGYIKKDEDVRELIANSKGLLNTSFKEGFPITFIEAWSVNTAVISLFVDPGGVINREKLGFCANGNYDQYVNYVRKFYRSESDEIRQYYLLNHSIHKFESDLRKYFIL